ncbi:acyl-CoA-binding domain-containing protein 3-like [Rosa rugosa]|uniref:acyl-CoA-binding domain-containing protein 3-like n=1 Tax=Rosa rugosa TaxID=74645 RepID=UPI002B4108DC|nr:acyl-CoA-binding domain-containing protein 3-like [Rosa rugosa]
MELVQDLVWTASVALILSFFVAKLVAIAMADREPESEFKVSESVGDGVVMEEVIFEERLRVEEVYQSQRRVEFAAEVKEVDRFESKPVRPVEEVVESVQHSQGGEESAAVEIAKKSDDGEKVSVEKANDSDPCQRGRDEEDQEISENILREEIGPQSAPNDVVTAHCSEAKGKIEAVEVKSENYYSDEDDWEGIEKSELDEGYTAAVKS